MKRWKKNFDLPAVVYVITNTVNGKRYIGVTSRTLKARMSLHASAAKRNVGGARIHKAIRRYGRGAFTIECLIKCASMKEALAEEVRLIAETAPDYNHTVGGEGVRGVAFSEKRRKVHRLVAERPDSRARWAVNAKLGPAASARRRVICLDTGQAFESASAAARLYKVAKSTVIELCLGKRGRRTVGGFRFAYEDAAA